MSFPVLGSLYQFPLLLISDAEDITCHTYAIFRNTFRSYLRCTVRRWLNTFRVTTMYVSTPSTVSLYMPRNWGSSVLPWHSTINWRQWGEERKHSVGVRNQKYNMQIDSTEWSTAPQSDHSCSAASSVCLVNFTFKSLTDALKMSQCLLPRYRYSVAESKYIYSTLSGCVHPLWSYEWLYLVVFL